jgi:RHS repeat-associated protein
MAIRHFLASAALRLSRWFFCDATRKSVASILTATFLLQPVAVISAQDESVPAAEQPSIEQKDDGVLESGEGAGDGEALLSGDEAFDPPTISNPNAFTVQSAAPKVDESTGALTHRVALDIPPGRNGLTPDLALQYNNQQLDDGIVGYAWSLSIPYVERLNRAGSERLYTDNYFTSAFGGELATTSIANEYMHRFEDGRFIKYTFSNNSWIAYDKKGTKYTFGATTSAQLYATTSPSNVHRWMLEEVRDTNNNYIRYEYVRDANTNQTYPSRVVYTGNGASDGIFTIDFTRATRPDPIISYRTGFRVETRDRISEIRASVNGSWVRKYTLSYTTGQNGARSLLASVQQTGRDELGSELSMPATVFSYASTTPGYTAHTNPRVFGAAHIPTDTNGNGLPDMNVFYGALPNWTPTRLIIKNEYPSFTELNGGTPPEYWSDSSYCYSSGWCDGVYRWTDRGVRYLDVTGDGKPDVIRSLDYSSGAPTRTFHRNISTTFGHDWVSEAATSTSIPMFAYQDAGGVVSPKGLFGNINGDGLVDYVMGGGAGYMHAGTSSPVWTQASSSFTAIASMPGSGTSQIANELVDINGDGLDDWMKSDDGYINFCLNNGSSWDSNCSSGWNIATSSRGINGWDRGIRFVDINGDGLIDYVRSYSVSTYTSNTVPHIEKGSYNYVYLNTGSGWATSSLQVPATITSAQHVSNKWTGRIIHSELVDWNGDGILDADQLTSTTTKPDLLRTITYPTGGSTDVAYVYSSQSGLNPNLAFPLLLVASTTNRDGLGSAEITSFTYEGGKMFLAGDVRDRRFAGFEKITKQDALGITQTYYHQGDTASTTAGEQTDSFALLGKPYREDVLSLATTTLRKTFNRWSVADLTKISTSTANTHSVDLETSSSQYLSIAPGSQTGLNFSDAMTLAGWVKFESAPSPSGFVGRFNSAAVTNRSYYFRMQDPNTMQFRWVIDNASTNGGNMLVSWTPATSTWYHVAITKTGTTSKFYINGSQQGSTYTGTNATIYNATIPFEIGATESGGTERLDGKMDDWRAWSRALSGSEIAQLYSGPSTFSNGSDLKGWWKFDGEYTDSSGSANTLTPNNSPVFSGDVSPLTGTATSSPTYTWFTSIDKEVVQDWDGGGTHKDRATEYTYSTSTGNLTQKVERGEVSAASDGTYSDIGSDARFTSFTFSASTTGNLSLPSSKVVKSNASTTVAETKFYYDNQAFGSTTKGNLTKEENWIAGSTYASTTKTYTAYGLVATSTDARGNTTASMFDAFNLYPATTTNALGHVTGALYDYAKGAAKRTTDPNGLVRTTTFDPVGRVLEEKQPDLTSSSTLVTSKLFTYTDTFPNSVRVRSYFTVATTSDVYTYRDGLGRALQERAQAAGNNTYAVKDYLYNSAGVLFEESLPYFASSTARSAATSTAALFTTRAYDALRRETSTVTSVGTTGYAYTPWQTRVTDPNGTLKDLVRDAYDNLASVTEFNNDGGEVLTTSYTYDALQNLTVITDALTNVRSFTYDGLSRRLAAQDLHDAGDVSFGTWNYAYDLAGNIASTSDPKGQVVNYSYDALNRITAEDYTGAGGTEVAYGYDACTYGKGRLCSASSTDARTTHAYNALGLIGSEGKWINGTSYASTTFAYDRQGNVASTTFPNGREVAYGFDAGGRIADIKTKPSGGSYSSILSRAEYAPHGQVSLRSYGNGIALPFSYKANQLYRLSGIGTSGSVQNLAYTYDSNGNILSIADVATTSAGRTVFYTYDDLNRLLSASTTVASSSPFWEEYRYNALGNLLYKGYGTTTGWANTRSIDFERSSNQYASISDGSQVGLDIAGSMTIALWAKLESTPGASQNYTLVSKNNYSGASRGYNFRIYDNSGTKLYFRPCSGGASCFNGGEVSFSPSIGTWYHLVVTFDTGSSGAIKYFVNGSQLGSTINSGVTSLNNSNGDFVIGADPADGTGLEFDGALDDVRVWSRALSPSEVAQLYGAPVTFANGGNLQGWWKFENSYSDGSGNGNSLAGQGSPVFATDVPYAGGESVTTADNYTYAETNYANPHAPTAFFNGVATTTYSYDNNGNLTGRTGAATSTYMWDYRNRMISAWVSGATSTYKYDHTIARMAQVTPTTTTHYPNKFYSVEYAGVSTTTGTSTAYIFHGDTLVAYIEQRLANGQATGTPTTYYVHPDHLGSTNVVTNASGTAVETLDYYPYGAERIHTGSADADRTFIGQFGDDATALSYLNARYYDAARGQFVSQDPMFWSNRQKLSNPQSLNSYSYAEGNPINRSDPTGEAALLSGVLQSLASTLRSMLAVLSARGSTGAAGNPNPGASGVNKMPTPVMTGNVAMPMRSKTWDPVTDRRISELDPRVQEPAREFVNDTQDWTGVKLRINEGYRSVAEQDKYYAQGRTAPGNIITNAQGGQSYHNYGKAVDVVIMTNGQPDWSKQITPDVAAYGKQQGFEWGGDWRGFKDYPHFQMPLGQSIPR